jgi:hypothetical protein
MKTWNATIALLTAAAVAWAAVPLPQRGVVQEYDTIDALLAGDPSQLTDTYIVKGLHAINDGLAGKFYYVAGSTATTNEVAVFAWGDGRLFRTYDGVTASLVYVTGGSTNYAGDLTIGNYLRLQNVVAGLGSGTVAVFDANGTITNGVASGFITEGNGITVSSSTVSTDLSGGTGITLSTNGSGTVTITSTGVGSVANPTAEVGLSAVNGSASTALRSDGAPALSQAIAPTWTSIHKYSANVGAVLTTGDTTFVDMQKASQTNSLSGALTFAHATNGLDTVEFTHVRTIYNGSGSDLTVSFPSGWLKGSGAGSSITVTNNKVAKVYVNSTGPTASSATQTNVSVTVSFF